MIKLTPSSVFYPVYGSTFDGSATELHRVTSDYTIYSGTVSFWLKLNGGDGTDMYIMNLYSGINGLSISRTTSNKIRIRIFVFSGTKELTYETSSSYTSSSGWIHVMSSWDTNLSVGNRIYNLYINGVSNVTLVADTGAAFQAGTLYSIIIGAFGNGGPASAFLNGSLSEVYLHAYSFIDLSTLSNRRQFLTATRRPRFLGSNGSLPNSVQPQLYLKGSGTGFNTNSGFAGALFTTGTLTTPTTTPST